MKRLLLPILAILVSLTASSQEEMRQFFILFHNDTVATVPCTYDADLCTYRTNLLSAGYSMPDSDAVKFQTYIDTAKFYGFYDSLKVVWQAYGGTANAHAIAFKGTNNLSFFNSPTHSANGIDWNGTTQYATSTYLGTSLSISSASFTYYSRENSGTIGTDQIPLGVYDGTNFIQLNITKGNVILGGTAAAIASYTPTTTLGCWIANRTATNDLKVYRNNVQVGSSTATITAMPTGAIWLGARNNGSAAVFATQQMAYADISGKLTLLQIQKKTEAVNRLQTSLYRNAY